MLVDPPIAMPTRTAFRIPAPLMILRAVIPRSRSFMTAWPESCAARSRPAITAGMVEVPGRHMPIASATAPMVLAVPRKEQEPTQGVASSSSLSNSEAEMVPSASIPTASASVELSEDRPSNWTPPSIGPPTTRIAGTSRRAAAMSMPGTILSQEPSRTTASNRCASIMISMSLVMSSRAGRMYRIPPWPFAIPSQGAITPNSTGVPPA